MFRKASTVLLSVSLSAFGLPLVTAGPSVASAPAAAVHTVQPVSVLTTCTAAAKLQRPPFAPTDVGLLSTVSYPQGPPMVPAPRRTITADALTVELRKTLENRAGVGSAVVTRGLQAFRDPRITAIIPDPNLRAALASLAGTTGEGSIRAIRSSGIFIDVRFGRPPNPDAGAMVINAGGGKSIIIFNARHRYEDFRLLGALFAHETLHADTLLNSNEELIATALQSALYGRLLLEQPRLATSRTELSRRINTPLVALLNTRDALGRQRLTTSTGNVLPGAVRPLPSFSFGFLGRANTDPTSTPGSTNLTFFFNKIVPGNQQPVAFNTATVSLLDRGQRWATADERIRLARILRLNTGTCGAS